MRREAVADRIVTYSDAFVAFSLVNGLAFLIALGEPDIRCSITRIAGFSIAVNLFFPIAATSILLWLRRYERQLRADEPIDELVRQFWKVVGVARFVLVWFFACVVIIGVGAATQDPACSVAPAEQAVLAPR